jgi:hypothetical protein
MVEFGANASYGGSVQSPTMVTSHSLIIPLACGQTYHFRVTSSDGFANTTVGDDTTYTSVDCPPPDLTAPVISNITVTPIGDTTATVAWTTDEPANTRIDWGADATYGNSQVNGSLVTSHSATVAFACGHTYHYRIVATDGSANTTTGDDTTYTSPDCPPPPPPPSCSPLAGNVVTNSFFESGKTPWQFFTDGTGAFTVPTTSPWDCTASAQVTVNTTGSNIQLWESGFSLQANKHYRLSFAAKSSNGRDIGVTVHRHTSPYTSYGLSLQTVPLDTDWALYTYDFTTTGFTGTSTDTRLRFVMNSYATAGTTYSLDGVTLTLVP